MLVVPFIGLKFHIKATNLVYHIVPLACFVSLFPFLKKYSNYIFSYLGLLTVYMLFKQLFWDLNTFKLFAILKNASLCLCCCLSILEFFRLGKFNIERFVNALYFLFFLQVVIAVGQYFIPQFSNFFYVIDSDDGLSIVDYANKLNNMRIISGTLISPSTLACFLSTSIFVLFLYGIKSRTLTIKKISLLFVGLVVLFMTGIRAPFFILVLFLSFSIYRIKKAYFLTFLLLSLMIYSSSLFTSTSYLGGGAAGRMLDGFNILSSGTSGLSGSTLTYSIMMFPFFLMDPIFGISLYKSTGYHLIANVYVSEMSVTDLYLMYLLCEVGIIGVILYILPLSKLRKVLIYKPSKKILFGLLLFGILLGIVDQGIFHFSVLILLLYGIAILSIADKVYKK